MAKAFSIGAAALTLALAGCGGGGGGDNAHGNTAVVAANGSGNANTAATTTWCFFDPADVGDFKVAPGRNPGRPLVVSGRARTEPDYKPQLSQPEVRDGVLRIWLTKAESKGSAGDWQDATYEHPNAEGITKVIVWCDLETTIAEIDVDGGAAGATAKP